MYCPKCGAPMKEGTRFCPRCGRERKSEDETWRVSKPSGSNEYKRDTRTPPKPQNRGGYAGKRRGTATMLIPALCIVLALAAAVAAVLLLVVGSGKQQQSDSAGLNRNPVGQTPLPQPTETQTAAPRVTSTPVATVRPTATPTTVQTPQPTERPADINAAEAYYVVRDPADTYVNLRSGAGTQYSVMTTIPNGWCVGSMDGETENGWYHVIYCDVDGWVTGAFIYTQDATVRDPADSYVNLRTGAGTQYSVVTAIPNGGTVRQIGLEDVDGWCEVEYGAYTGWVYAAFIEGGTN